MEAKNLLVLQNKKDFNILYHFYSRMKKEFLEQNIKLVLDNERNFFYVYLTEDCNIDLKFAISRSILTNFTTKIVDFTCFGWAYLKGISSMESIKQHQSQILWRNPKFKNQLKSKNKEFISELKENRDNKI